MKELEFNLADDEFLYAMYANGKVPRRIFATGYKGNNMPAYISINDLGVVIAHDERFRCKPTPQTFESAWNILDAREQVEEGTNVAFKIASNGIIGVGWFSSETEGIAKVVVIFDKKELKISATEIFSLKWYLSMLDKSIK